MAYGSTDFALVGLVKPGHAGGDLAQVDVLAAVGEDGTHNPVVLVCLGISHLDGFAQYRVGQSAFRRVAKRLRQFGCVNAVEPDLVGNTRNIERERVAVMHRRDGALQEFWADLDAANGGYRRWRRDDGRRRAIGAVTAAAARQHACSKKNQDIFQGFYSFQGVQGLAVKGLALPTLLRQIERPVSAPASH